MHNATAHHLLTDARAPFPNPDQPPLQAISPIYIQGVMFCGVEYPFGKFESPVPAMFPLWFFAYLLAGSAWDKEENSPWLWINMI